MSVEVALEALAALRSKQAPTIAGPLKWEDGPNESHAKIPFGSLAIEIMGDKTAYSEPFWMGDEDPSWLTAPSLEEMKALLEREVFSRLQLILPTVAVLDQGDDVLGFKQEVARLFFGELEHVRDRITSNNLRCWFNTLSEGMDRYLLRARAEQREED